jgi:ADP-ribosylglycohydrolase
MIDDRSRVLGCFLGGAVGDALGAPVEFMRLDEIRRIFGPDGVNGFWSRAANRGAFTDDTQMTLFTAEGLIRAMQRMDDRGLVDIQTVVWAAYIRWLDTQGQEPVIDLGLPSDRGFLVDEPLLRRRMAPGNTCLSALRSGRMGMIDRALNDSKGCGGAMRVAPASMVPGDVFELGSDLAAITHSHPSGYLAGGALALIIRELLDGTDLESAAQTALVRVKQDPKGVEVAAALTEALDLAGRDAPTADKVQTLGAGWVAEEALAIAVYCALVAGDFEHGVLLAVNHSGDSDSTGSIAGQILGAMHGVEAIPGGWLDELEGRELVERMATDFVSRFIDGRTLDFGDYPPN